MKRLLVVLTLLFVSLNMIACSQKKDSKTRLTKGSGRESAIANTAAVGGWQMLNQQSEETELRNSNPDAAARAFIGNDAVFVGVSQINSVAMRLVFNGSQLNTQNTMMGLRFYDNWDDPIAYFLGASMNRRAVQGSKNGNIINVVFEDRNEDGQSLGNVIVSGEIQGSRFVGKVEYAGGFLGEFSVNANAAIFNY